MPAGLNGIVGGYAYITNAATGGVDFVATPAANTNIAAPSYSASGSFIAGLPVSGSLGTVNYLNTANLTIAAPESVNSLKLSGGRP